MSAASARHDQPDDAYAEWDAKTIAERWGRSISTIHRWVAQDRFPRPIPRPDDERGPRLWKRSVVEHWLRERGNRAG